MGRISGRAEKPLQQLMVLLYSFNKKSIAVVHFSFYGIKCGWSLSKPQVSQQCLWSLLSFGWWLVLELWVSLSCDWVHDQRAVSSPMSYVNRMGNLRRKGQNLAYEKRGLEFVTIRKLRATAAAAAQHCLIPITQRAEHCFSLLSLLRKASCHRWRLTKWFKTGQCEVSEWVSEWETFEHSALN